MREILFRGKNRYENKWVYGAYSLWDYSPETESITTDASIIDYNDECLWVRVIPETIGQYTGLTDKNGTKIFEGDIVKIKFPNTSIIKIDVVRFANGGFLPFIIQYDAFDWGGDDCEVIGNIHDNLELLESEVEGE